MISNIDFLIVGAGLYGATIGRLLTDAGFNCLIIERRNHIGGNIYSEKIQIVHDAAYGISRPYAALLFSYPSAYTA